MVLKRVLLCVVVCATVLGIISGSALSHDFRLSQTAQNRTPEAVRDRGKKLTDNAQSIWVEGAIINPFQTADVGTEVSGIIERFPIREGEFIAQGQTVVEISKRRYSLLAKKAAEDLELLEAALDGARREREMSKELLSFHGTTRQALRKAETEETVAAIRVKQARTELEIARLNLMSCQVSSPFDGFLAVRYKQPFEPVERLEKIFAIVDSAKVYAVGNVREDFIPKVTLGQEAVFVRGNGDEYAGKVDKMGKLIDPTSKTKRIYVLIDNSKNQLEIGIMGRLLLRERTVK